VRRLVIAVTAAAALAWAPGAAAKQVTSVTACGVDGCVTTTDPAVLQAMMNGGAPSDPPAHPSGAIRLRSRIEEPDGTTIGRFVNWWVPRTAMLLSEDGMWIAIPHAAVQALDGVAADLEPFGPERLGARFADTGAHAAPPPPVSTVAAPAPAPEPAGDGGSALGAWLVGVPVGVALAAAGALLLVRRRPGGATP
jgi:hypothetical protein